MTACEIAVHFVGASVCVGIVAITIWTIVSTVRETLTEN
jgi:hypothetical protein